ncbi:hypothetical protein [Cellulomonas edaphi]|uniref:Uncharacterized protein n=1 Tax=Cellulomonas edaphi TaxID=3053468 RepID=A0ABT7S413_9CELL|nr:hypothetical protein [Cellulomons edaphi]MDM7830259.1 hypothetical protein [Cellulomons edaphi]
MDRISRPYWLRATGSQVPWATVLRAQMVGVPGLAATTHVSDTAAPWVRAAAAQLKDRAVDTQLRWQCNPALGVPFGPFTVWVGRPRLEARTVDVVVREHDDGLLLRLPTIAAVVVVDAQVIDPSRPVGILGTYRGGGLTEAMGAAAVQVPGGGRAFLQLKTAGITRVLLTNGTDPQVRVVPLQDVIDDPGWKPVELVGLPVDTPWAGTDYDTSQQGILSALTDPLTAAHQRLDRGGPPLGWAPVTSTGHAVSPPWRAPDPTALLKEITADLLPRIDRLYRPGRTPADQAALADSPPVDPPSSGTKSSSLATRATLSPLSLLTLPASADPFLALATGFGTAYPATQLPRGEGLEFMVTADYPDTPIGTGPVQVAAYVPEPEPHIATTTPHALTTRRSGLLAPAVRDAAWRESVQVQWDRVPGSVAMGRPTSGVVARFEGASPAEVLVEERLAGDRRALVLVPDGPAPTPAFGRTSMVDADAEIPLGSGGRHVGYPVAVQDVFGVWSPWADAPWDGDEPGPPGPHVVGVSLTSEYAGTTACPAVLTVEVAVEWRDRTPLGVDLAAVLFRTPTAAAPPPAGVDPVLPAPAGAFRRDVTLTFAGETLDGPVDVTVEHLNEAGDAVVTPGTAQGDHGRRYRLTIPVPTLDFSSTLRWGVQVWARVPLSVVGDAGFLPDPAHPALAGVASPVPVPPILPPAPPGVPLGSTPDAQGRSHVRVHWSIPSGAALDTRKGIAVWECAETALRQSAGLSQRAPDGTLPGVRLAQLWDTYDAMTAVQRRAAFRRILELPGTSREADVALPAGSTDIHLFTVTTLSATGVASDWPTGSPAHAVLQSVAAPRLRRPGPPRVRTVLGAAGTVSVSLTADSDVPVATFLLHRTRSAEAALRPETMGPAFASVPAVAPAPGAPVDPASGHALYTGSWSGGFDESWDDWHVRAVAVPVDTVPVEAVRGLPSPASDVVVVRVRPSAPPDLAPLVATVLGGAHDGVLVTTSTASPARAVPDGAFRVSASAVGVGGAAIGAVDPLALGLVPPGPVSGGAAPGPFALVAGTRAAGRTPLALWFTRPVAADPVDVQMTLVDPAGRTSVQAVTVPGWVPDPPSLELVDVSPEVGYVLARIASDASLTDLPPTIMTITVSAPRRPFPPFRVPIGRIEPVAPEVRELVGDRLLPDLPLRGLPGVVTLPVSLEIALADIPRRARISTAPIVVTRSTTDPPHEYRAVIRVTPPFTLRVSLLTGDGRSTQVSRAVR